MKKYFLFIVCLLLTFFSNAQINLGGEPLSWSLGISPDIPVEEMPLLDINTLRSEDEVNDQIKESPYRFGQDHPVSINFFDEAVITNYQDKTIYQMSIYCPEALSIGFLFDAFHLPEGASLFVYNENRTELKGAFTHRSNKDNGIFPVGLIKDKKIILEYNGPTEGAILHISEVTHGYRNMLNKWESEIKGPFGESDECHMNVNCDVGIPWQDQKRAVVLITEGGENHCSGAIINNTLQDGTPYLLTANHCLGDPSGWVFYFNHESESCFGDTGPIDQSIAGGTLRANSLLSDFALIELSAEIPIEYNVFYAGWDNSDEATVTSAVTIHHPSGDVKKISFDDDAPTPILNSAGFEVWNLLWENGTTEGGSSGSPLFDQNGRIIGQLHGGRGSCNGTFPGGYADFYGRFGIDWDGPDSTSRLKDWLDPNDSGLITLDGFGPNDVIYALNAVNLRISQIPKVVCSDEVFLPSFSFKNNGSSELTSATIQVSYNGVVQPLINWTGMLERHASETIQLDEMTPVFGEANTIEVVILDINGEADEFPTDNTTISTVDMPVSIPIDGDLTFSIFTDDYGYETSWRLKDIDGEDLFSGGLFSSYDDFTTYTDVINIPTDGCYSFILYDNYGDGICCGSGDGSYSLTDDLGNVLASGGEFGGRETIVLQKITNPTSIKTTSLLEDVEVFPNPTDGLLNVKIISEINNADLRLINILGQVVRTTKLIGSSTSMDIKDLLDGTYFLEINASGKVDYEKIILKR